jgi:hypothetical protein
MLLTLINLFIPLTHRNTQTESKAKYPVIKLHVDVNKKLLLHIYASYFMIGPSTVVARTKVKNSKLIYEIPNLFAHLIGLFEEVIDQSQDL